MIQSPGFFFYQSAHCSRLHGIFPKTSNVMNICPVAIFGTKLPTLSV